MKTMITALAFTAAIAIPAQASPMVPKANLAIATGENAAIHQVQWRRHYGPRHRPYRSYRHHRPSYGWGPALGGLAAGAIIGGAIASSQAKAANDQYCLQRFKSYDPMSGTYLGYDGYRHPCP